MEAGHRGEVQQCLRAVLVQASLVLLLRRAGSGDDERLKWDAWPGNSGVRVRAFAGAGLRLRAGGSWGGGTR